MNKKQIKSVFYYQNPVLWILVLVLLCVIAFVCFWIKLSFLQENKTYQQKFFTAAQSYKNEKTVEKYLLSLPNEPTDLGKTGIFMKNVDSREMKDIWNDFVSRVNGGDSAMLTLANCTDEGDMIYDYLYYDGNKFFYMTDTTRDRFGDRNVSRLSCGKYFVTEDYESEFGIEKLLLLSDDKEITPGEFLQMILSSDSSAVSNIDYEKIYYFDSIWQYGQYQDIVK